MAATELSRNFLAISRIGAGKTGNHVLCRTVVVDWTGAVGGAGVLAAARKTTAGARAFRGILEGCGKDSAASSRIPMASSLGGAGDGSRAVGNPGCRKTAFAMADGKSTDHDHRRSRDHDVGWE